MRHFEFWPPRLFEVPYYLALLAGCARLGLPPMHLAKANYALDHGELALGSKYATQMAFDQTRFPATVWLHPADSQLESTAFALARRAGYPLILKPDIGSVGKGVIKVDTEIALCAQLRQLRVPHLLQAYVDLPAEFGVFYVRKAGQGAITGINEKHFPAVVGDGRSSIETLARRHERYSAHWAMFLKDLPADRVPEPGETVRLSYVGSHTMGCRFTNDSAMSTPALQAAIDDFCASQPGFNFGRLDVRARDTAALQAGDFTVIEVNGVASLPTHMFDPAHSLRDGYRIFLAHARHLVEVAAEHRTRPMALLPPLALLRKARRTARVLNGLQRAAAGP